MHVPQVPEVPQVPIDVPEVPEVPTSPQFVWHVHVLPMFTFREQDELVNKKYVLQMAL